MRWIVVCTLLIVASLTLAGPRGVLTEPEHVRGPVHGSGSLLDLLPDSTLAAAEIHDVGRRWSALRGVPAIAAFQNRLFYGSGLEPDDLPLLTGNRAALALVPACSGRTVIPIAVLRPPDLDRAEAILDVRAGARPDRGATWCRVRGRNALWVGPANAMRDVEAIALGDGTSLSSLLPTEEAAGRLPAGGLVRGWINPVAVRRFLRDATAGTRPAVVELLTAAVAAELDAVRWIGFRRDVVAGNLVADAVVTYDRAKLPVPVARIFNPGASSPPLPAELPEDVVYIAAFRPEAQACLSWLRFLEASDARGPFRNLDFWIDEFEEHSGLSLEQDLLGALGEHAWELLLESREGEAVQWAAVFEAVDAKRVEATLSALHDWAAEHAWVRSFGLAWMRSHKLEHDGKVVHATRIGTLLGELSGPAFAATDAYVIVGLGDRAVRAALDLVSGGSPSGRPERGMEPLPHASVVLRGPALARTLEAFVGADSGAMAAVMEFLARIETVSASVTYETDGLRMHAEAVLAPDVGACR